MSKDDKNWLIEYDKDREKIIKRFDDAIRSVAEKYYNRDRLKLKVACRVMSVVLTALLVWQVSLLGIQSVMINLALICVFAYVSVQASVEIVLKLYAVYVWRQIAKRLGSK